MLLILIIDLLNCFLFCGNVWSEFFYFYVWCYVNFIEVIKEGWLEWFMMGLKVWGGGNLYIVFLDLRMDLGVWIYFFDVYFVLVNLL